MKRHKQSCVMAVFLALTLSLGLASCGRDGHDTSSNDSTPEQIEQVAADEEDAEIPDVSEIAEQAEAQENEETAPTVDTPEPESQSEADAAIAEGDAIAENVMADQDPLTDQQRNSLAMLNYLSVVTEDINSSKNSRLMLEDIYSTLINNTYPNAIDDRTLAQLEGLLDTIEGYRMVDVKRDRLEYIYEQNQAQAMRAAMPNPLGLLSAVQSGDMVKLATSVVYMAVDSYSSYKSASSAAQLEYLREGWELDDQQSAILHERRKDSFTYTVRIVTDYNLPGYLSLNESSVEQLVEWAANSNVVRRIRFLESNQDTYKGYAGYWLILASSYYQNEDYQKCLGALSVYESMPNGIFRKDYNYAKAIPLGIVAASKTMDSESYAAYAEQHAARIKQNCDNTDWELLYFAAQTYVDLYARTGNAAYLRQAYEIAYDNVNFLIDKQTAMNAEYLAPVKDAKAPADATKEQKDEIKQYNRMIKEVRKTELPPVYQPLLVNCDLLLALADELGISDSERTSIDRMLHPGGDPLFLTKTIDDKYHFTQAADENPTEVNASFEGTQLTLPTNMLSAETVIDVRTDTSGEAVPGTWSVKKVNRGGKSDVGAFSTILENKDAKGSYKDGDIVVITIIDGDGEAAATEEIRFKASVEERGFLPDNVSFELVA